MYQVTIQNLDEPTRKPSVYNVTDTKLDVNGIQPCSNYLITVSSFSKFLLLSEPTNYNYSTNMDYSCTTNSVKVSWSSVIGASSYLATAMGENGTKMECTSKSTTCTIIGLRCGQYYEVNVIPISDNCKNQFNTTSASFQTVPCPPGNLMLLRECTGNVIVFSWNHTSNIDYYMARAVDSKGEVMTCLTEDNSCYFTNTECGRRYYFTVNSFTKGCRSEASASVDVQTAPCIPQNLKTSASCSSDVLVSTWDHAEGALGYVVEAKGNIRNSSYTCKSNSNSCAMEGVLCGDQLTMTITASDAECSSPAHLGPPAETEPCPPSQLTASVNCTDNSAKLTWDSSPNAVSYTGKATSSDGHIVTCEAGLKLGCQLNGLQCGKKYTFTVSASDGDCRTVDSEPVNHTTAPCAVQGVLTKLNCSTNALSITWTPGSIPVNYSATAVAPNGTTLRCFTEDYKCTLGSLQCGYQYNVSVKPISSTCEGQSSVPEIINSVPCVPLNVQSNLECSTNTLQASWKAAAGATSYISTLRGAKGFSASCQTTNQSCAFPDLQCAQSYSFSVVAINDRCNSTNSNNVTAKT
ncbi:hypothetical protein GOODEAATRI_000589, partial [Goodea atripinnis]